MLKGSRPALLSAKVQAHAHCAAAHSYPLLQVLIANAVPAEQYKVVYKRPSDLALGKDVPICCNILLCDMLDEGAVCLLLGLHTFTAHIQHLPQRAGG